MTYIETLRNEYCSKIKSRVLETLTGSQNDGRYVHHEFCEAVHEAVSLDMISEEGGEKLRDGVKLIYTSADRSDVIIHLADILSNEDIRQFIGKELSDTDINTYLEVALSYSRRERLGLAH